MALGENRSVPFEEEATRIGRYVLGVDPSQALVRRYGEAQRILFGDPPSAEDRALLDFVDRHPWAWPFLEAAAGLIRPQSRIRRKALVLLAILETTPEHAQRFEPKAVSLPGLIVRLAGLGLAGALRITAGLVLYALVRMRS